MSSTADTDLLIAQSTLPLSALAIDNCRIHEATRLAYWIDVCRGTIRSWDYYPVYTSLELIRSSRVLAAGSAHNVLSVVTYQSISSRLKVYPDRRTRVYSTPGSVALVKTVGVSNWQTSKTCRSACGAACMWSASHITGVALTIR